MAVRTIEYKTDDLEELKKPGAEVRDARTVPFSVDGEEYEIDLTAANREKLHKALDPYKKAGRRVKVPRARRSRGIPVLDTAKIREWARSQGYTVNDRGRVPARIVAEYQTAHKA